MDNWLGEDILNKIDTNLSVEIANLKSIIHNVDRVIQKYRNDETLSDSVYNVIQGIMDEVQEALDGAKL